jgi:hypothetical protein
MYTLQLQRGFRLFCQQTLSLVKWTELFYHCLGVDVNVSDSTSYYGSEPLSLVYKHILGLNAYRI